MANIIKLFTLITFTLFFIYSCNDSGPTIDNTPTGDNHAPVAPNNPFPHNDTINVPRYPLTVSWLCEDPDAGDTVKYDVYMANDNPPTNVLVTNITARSYTLQYLLDSNLVYFWKIVAKDNHGAVTTGPTWKFRTGAID